MRIARIENCALAEFADAITAVVFFQGCDMDCSFCQNPELIPKMKDDTTWQEVVKLIQWNYVDWLSLTGGEPLIQEWDSVHKLMQFAKQNNVKVNIDTNGTMTPIKMKNLWHSQDLIDCISVSIKQIGNTIKTRYTLNALYINNLIDKTRFRVVVVDENSIPLDEKIASLFLGKHVSKIQILPNSKQGRGVNLPVPTPELLDKIIRFYGDLGMEFWYNASQTQNFK